MVIIWGRCSGPKIEGHVPPALPFRALPPLLGAVAQYVLLWQSVGVSASGVAGTFSRGGGFSRGDAPPDGPPRSVVTA